MVRHLSVFIILIALVAVVFSCTHKPKVIPVASDGNFPPEIARIFINKCAISGCHNAASYGNNDSVLLDSWDHLFNGGNSGAVVVPYSTQYSLLLYSINTDTLLGPTLAPVMPFSTTAQPQPPLTKTEYLTIYNWIAKGAPDKNGNIPFADHADTRQKIYLTQQGCDLLAVIDAERKVVMRYIPIGADPNQIESPHCVRVSDDGMHAYVSFINGSSVQKIDTRTDQVIGSVDVAAALLPGGIGGSWNILHLSPGQDTALVTSDWQSSGALGYVTTPGMQVVNSKSISPVTTGGTPFVYPHGITSNASFDTFFVTSQYGNTIYKVTQNPLATPVAISLIAGQQPVTTNNTDISSPNPHEILMAPDYSKYFVTCQSTNEVRVMDAHTDAVLDSIKVGPFPQEIAISPFRKLLFVTCMEDGNNPNSGRKGSVYAIDYSSAHMTIKKVIYGDFYQPHGITVDERSGLILIASTNANPNGPAPHHSTACGGRDGWYTFYDLNTLQPALNKRYEVPPMPYSAAVRFK